MSGPAGATMARPSPWLIPIGTRDRPRARVLCVPYAGAGTSAFREWPVIVPQWLEVWAVRLPARESRLAEPPIGHVAPVVAAIADQLAELDPLPYALYGHSMGALVSFELARELRRRGVAQPRHLFCSGRRGPQIPDALPGIHHLPKPEFLAAVRRLNGIPERLLAEPGLIDLIEPALRADFAVCETHRHTQGPPLGYGISVFGGWSDPTTTRDQLEAWRAHTRSTFRMHMYAGDHFFIHTNRDAFLADLLADFPGD